jgi:hypothetical protein
MILIFPWIMNELVKKKTHQKTQKKLSKKEIKLEAMKK